MKLIASCFFLFPLTGLSQPTPHKALSVCELLEHIQKYRDKEVYVRGEPREGPEEVALYGEGCTQPLMTNGHVWPNAIWLTPPDGLAERPVNFSLNEEALEAMKKKIESERAAGKRGKVTVTVIGKLEARKKLFGGPGPDGGWIGNGFGHLNAYACQIVIRTVEDVEIADR